MPIRDDNSDKRSDSRATGWLVGIIIGLAILAIVYLVVSASNPPQANSMEPRLIGFDAIRVDPETGCQYLYVKYRSYTPRLDTNGRPICTGTIGKTAP